MGPNNTFKPNLLRSTKHMAEKACHVLGSAAQVGLTQALGGWMKHFATLLLLVVLAPMPVKAVCIIEPLEPQLRSADIVYVGTVVSSELVPNLETLRTRKDPWRDRAKIKHTLVPEIILKGDPSQAPVVFSMWQYNDPRSKIVVNFAERSALMPGDTLLVVVQSGEPTWFGLCSATREWDADTAKVAYAVFPPAP